MGIKIYKPTSPGRRGMTGFDFSEITKSTPEKKLTSGKLLTSRKRGECLSFSPLTEQRFSKLLPVGEPSDLNQQGHPLLGCDSTKACTERAQCQLPARAIQSAKSITQLAFQRS